MICLRASTKQLFFFTAKGLASYNRVLMSKLPVEINPFRLIEQRKVLQGTISLQQLPRLLELAMQSEGEFEVQLDFSRSDSQLPQVTGAVKGQVALQCQRCLAPVMVEVDTESVVVLTESETDRRPEEAGHELYIVQNERLFLQDFIEDEILLALPVVPRHEQCELVRPLGETEADAAITTDTAQADEKENPFAILKDWKKTE